MDKKKATPKEEAAPVSKVNNITPCKLGDYEKRCCQRLVRGCCERPELDRHVGTTNSPEYVRKLRNKGLVIPMTRVNGTNRDGRKIWWGRYCLNADSLAKAKGLLGGD